MDETKRSEHWPLDEFDAREWAQAWNEDLVRRGHQPEDPGLLIAWFANAIMTGYDNGYWKGRREVEAELDAAKKEIENVCLDLSAAEEELEIERSRSAALVEALKKIANALPPNALSMVAAKALSSHGREEGKEKA